MRTLGFKIFKEPFINVFRVPGLVSNINGEHYNYFLRRNSHNMFVIGCQNKNKLNEIFLQTGNEMFDVPKE